MFDGNDWIPREAEKSLQRLLPRLRGRFQPAATEPSRSWMQFEQRLAREWPDLFKILLHLYGGYYDFFYHLEKIVSAAARSWLERPDDLKRLDEKREAASDWFLSQQMIGGVLYVDLFSDNLSRLHAHIPYFKKLGLTYLHLMPLFAVPHGDNDGGYAVSDYRAVNPTLGTMEELAELAAILRQEGISLVLDFVLNHTSDDHYWARRAQTGDREFQEYYHLFPDRTLPDQYQRNLRDIFPTVRRGSYTWHAGMKMWVWTTFNSFQWDLNYANPAVFRAMAEEMLFLANRGTEVLRLDAVAFIWKRMGTPCENQPEAHLIVQAFNALARIAAPTLLFKSEAIVHPDEVIKYIDPKECQLSYNPTLMALIWEALATRDVKLLANAMHHRDRLPRGCAWVNYLRCHDDIGWTFDDEDAVRVGIDPGGHRKFLNEFYTGRFPGSFARGLPFQFNPGNGDLRISGTLASLAGLEQALETEKPDAIELAVRRINMLRSIMISAGGIPLIYLGDEWGMLNDYTFLSDPAKAVDSRWVHRSRKRWETREDLTHAGTLEWRFFNELIRLIHLRKKLPAFYNGGMAVVETGSAQLFGFIRQGRDQRLLIVNNFSETAREMTSAHRQACGFEPTAVDLISGEIHAAGMPVQLKPYQFVWLESTGRSAPE
jgi:amylosucrase